MSACSGALKTSVRQVARDRRIQLQFAARSLQHHGRGGQRLGGRCDVEAGVAVDLAPAVRVGDAETADVHDLVAARDRDADAGEEPRVDHLPGMAGDVRLPIVRLHDGRRLRRGVGSGR